MYVTLILKRRLAALLMLVLFPAAAACFTQETNHAPTQAVGIYRSSKTLLLNAEAGYQINKTWRISVEALNLLERHDHDIDYAYISQVTPTVQPRFQDVFHPTEPFQVRAGLTARF